MKPFHNKKSIELIKVPDNVKKAALEAFKLKNLGFKGGLNTGWLRAKQLSTKKFIPIEDLRVMRNWYARHFYTSYPTYKQWKQQGKPKDIQWHSKRGIIAWLIWGGTPGLEWVNNNVKKLNTSFNTNYKFIK